MVWLPLPQRNLHLSDTIPSGTFALARVCFPTSCQNEPRLFRGVLYAELRCGIVEHLEPPTKRITLSPSPRCSADGRRGGAHAASTWRGRISAEVPTPPCYRVRCRWAQRWSFNRAAHAGRPHWRWHRPRVGAHLLGANGSPRQAIGTGDRGAGARAAAGGTASGRDRATNYDYSSGARVCLYEPCCPGARISASPRGCYVASCCVTDAPLSPAASIVARGSLSVAGGKPAASTNGRPPLPPRLQGGGRVRDGGARRSRLPVATARPPSTHSPQYSGLQVCHCVSEVHLEALSSPVDQLHLQRRRGLRWVDCCGRSCCCCAGGTGPHDCRGHCWSCPAAAQACACASEGDVGRWHEDL